MERAGGRYSEERRNEIFEAALAVLAERGYRDASMLEVAHRAHASKETLYSWFGDKGGLFEQLVSWQAERLDEALAISLEPGGGEARTVLRAFAVELLRLLLWERAVVINRVAISEYPADPAFARILTSKGRGTVVPKLVRYLEEQRSRGRLRFHNAEYAAEVFVGLIVGDMQVRRLLGSLPEPEPAQVEARARRAVEDFRKLFATG
ncbi:MAG: TetR/AcrR family transcriptional regulator [Rubrobacter sp.]